MKKGTKSFGGFIVVTLSAILIIAAIVAAAFYNEVVIPEPETRALAAGEDYLHGSDIGRNIPSGSSIVTINTNDDSGRNNFLNAIQNNSDISLQTDLELISNSNPGVSQVFRAGVANGVYTGTIYGNGHTISYGGLHDGNSYSATFTTSDGTSGNFMGWNIGGIVNTLSGAIYDLNVVMTGKNVAIQATGDNSLFLGGITGGLQRGGKIVNCTFTNEGSGRMVAARGNAGGIFQTSESWVAAGGIVGKIENAGSGDAPVITNCTVKWGGGWLQAGQATTNDGNLTNTDTYNSAVGLVFGISMISANINNIIVEGSVELSGSHNAPIGVIGSSGATISGTNYYTKLNVISANDNAGGNSAFVVESGSASVGARFIGAESNDSTSNSTANAITVPANVQIYFDPGATDYSNSLVVVHDTDRIYSESSVSIYAITAAGSSSVTATSHEVVNNNGYDRVIFRDLSTTPADWKNDQGLFSYEASIQETVKLDDLTEYDHGYVPKGYTPSGTGLSSTELFDLFVNRNNSNHHNGEGEYYLEEDAVITGFTGRDFGGTLDGKGHTVYIVDAQTGLTGTKIGGLVGTLTGTIKNIRIVIASSVTLSTTGENPNSFGLVAGAVDGGTFENVNVVVVNNVTVTAGASNSGKTAALGGLAGCTVGTSTSGCTVSNCTVEINGTLSANGSYVFLAGFIGRSYNVTSTLYDYDNIILKGSGQFAGVANASTEPKCVAAISVMCGSSGTTQLDLDGLIYNFTNETPVAGTYSCYGYFANNTYSTQMSQELSANNYINYNNVYTFGCEMNEYWWDRDTNNPNSSSWNGNTYIHIPTTAAISGSVKDLDGSTVTPYFRPGSTANITLVAAAPSSGWGDYYVLKPVSVTGVYSEDSGEYKVVDVAKASAASMINNVKTIALERYNVVTDFKLNLSSSSYIGEPIHVNSVTIHRQGSDATTLTEGYTVTIRRNGSIVESMLESGAYNVTLTFDDGSEYQFYDSALGGLSYISQSKSVTIYVASVTIIITFNESSSANRNAEITYGESTPTPVFITNNSALNENKEVLNVQFTYNGEIVAPTNAGVYTVNLTYNNSNVQVTNIQTATLTINPKTVALAANSVEKTFASDSGAITSTNVNANETYGLTINGFIDSDTNAAYTVSLARPVYIEENGTSTEYLAKGEYILTVTLSSSNYTFGTNSDKVSVTVLKNAGANRFTTEYQRAGWKYYSDPTKLSATPVARFGTVNAIVYTDSEGETIDSFSKTTPVGTYTATVTVDGNDSYDALSRKYTFDISQLTVSITGISAETVDYTTAAYAGNITITIDGYSAEDVAAILGEITYKHRLASATETEYTSGLPTNAGAYTLGIESVGNVTAGNISVSGLDTVTADLVINKKTVAFNAVTPGGTNLAYGSAADPMSVVTVSPVIPEGFESDFTADDWWWDAVFEEGYVASTAVNTPVTLTVSVTIEDDNYTAQLDQSEFEFTVVQATLTLTVEGLGTLENGVSGWIYDGTAHEPTVSVPDDLGADVVLTYYTVSDGSYTAIEGNIAPTDAGNYAVTASISGDKNYADVTSKYFEYTIQKAQMVIEVTMNGWIYNGNAGTAAVVSGQQENPVTDVTYIGTPNGGTTDEYDSPDVPTNAGSYRVVVSVQDTANYFGVSQTVVPFTVDRAALSDLSVSVEGWTYDATEHYIRNAPENGTVITPVVENNSGSGDVTYTWYSVSGDQQVVWSADYIRNAGVYRVTAMVAETNNYSGGEVSHDFTVAKHVVTVKTDPYKFVYGKLEATEANYAKNYPGAVTGFLGTDADSSFELRLGYTSGQVTDVYVNAGKYDLTVTLIKEGATNYAFKIDGTLSGTATIPVVISQYTDNKWTAEYSNPGWTYYSYPANTIENAQTATTAQFGKPTFAYEVMGADGSWTTYSDGWANATPAGTYRVTVTVAETDNYNGLSKQYEFVVAKRDVTFNISSDITTVYGADYKVTFTVVNDGGLGSSIVGAVTYEFRAQNAEETAKWTEGLPEDAGIYDVRVKSWGNSANVNLVGDTALVVKIDCSEVKFTVSLKEGAEIVYGMTLEDVRKLVGISTDTELKYGSEIGVMAGETAYSETVNAGTLVTVTVEITVENPNYTATVTGEKAYDLEVKPATIKVTADAASSLRHNVDNYNEPADFYQYIVIDGATPLKNGHTVQDLFTITLPELFDDNESEFEIAFSVNEAFEGRSNYVFTDDSVWVIILTLSTDSYTLKVEIDDWKFGEEANNPEISGAPMSLVHGVQFNYTGDTYNGKKYDSTAAPTEAGKYTIKATIAATSDYTEGVAEAEFVISPAVITLESTTPNAATYDPDTEITYFMAAFAEYFTVAFPANGVTYTDEFGDIFSLSATKDNEGAVESIKNAGTYTLTPTLENKNYSITDIPSLTYTVNKANMIVTVSVANWVYGEYSSDNAPVIDGIMEDADLLEGYSVVYTLTSDESDTPIDNIAAAGAGEYTVTVTVPNTDNYIGMTAEATFYITKTTFESAVTIKGWTYGEYDAELNAPSVTKNPGNADVSYKYTGRDGTEYAESDLVPENAGYYTVTAYIAESNNYSAVTVSCNFAIGKASVSPAIDAELSKTYDGDAVAFTLTEGSNPGMGEVTYVIEREISGEYVTVTEARYSGNYRVRATVSETANYNGATTGYVPFAIGQKAVTASWSVADAALVYGNGYDEALALILIDKEAVLAQFAADDGEWVEFLLAATVADGSDYSERVNAGTAVTFGLSIEFAEGTAQDIVGSYDISVTGAGSKTVAPRSIEIAATDTSDVYGSSFTADGSLAEYFAENFTYNCTSVNAIADEYTTVAFAVNGTSGAAIPNAGTYTVTVTVGGNYTGAASAAYTIGQKPLTVAAGYELPFGVLNAENIAEYGYEALLGGFVGDESVDYTVRADDELGDEDSSFGFLNVGEYVLTVEIAENTNYTFETGYTAKFTVNIEKTDNAWIVEYARGDWTYLSEPAAVTSPEARFAESDIDVRYYADSGYTVEMAPEAFTAATPAGTYYVTVSVPGSDNFNALRAEYSFEIYRLRAEMGVSTPEAVYDGEPYDGLTYTVSGAAADVVGEIGWMYIGEGMSDYVPGLPVNAGSYAVRIASVENLSIDIINITETFALVIDPATVNFTVRIVSGMSVTYGDEITNAAAFVNTPVPDIDVGEFTYTVTAYNSRGALYTSGLQAGEQVSFAVEVTIEDTNYVANVRSTPSLTVRRLALEPEIVVGDETVTHGDEISVSNGSEFLVIDAITRYMADNGVRYYEYDIYVNGARYTTDYAFTPGEYEISVAIDGNYSGELRLTVNVDENPELSVASAEPETAIGRFLDSINLSVAGAVAILLGFMVSLVVCLLIGLRKRGSE